MVDRVLVHVGLPKTATSYLQSIVWSNRDRLRAAGLTVPGSERRDHLWACREIRQDHHQDSAPLRHRTAWTRLREELARARGTGLVSHEFLASASPEQATTMVAALAPAQVELVVTAREPVGLLAASWQESLKNGSTTPMSRYGREVSESPLATWNWRTLDLRLVLERWGSAVPPERTHVLVLDPTAPREDVWQRFAAICGLDPGCVDLSSSFPNSSMGVAQAETLRRMNAHLAQTFVRAFDKGVYLRTFLADERLVAQDGERFWPDDDQVEDARERGRRAVEHLRGAPYDVSGSLEHLLVPDVLEQRRRPSSVSDAEVAEVAVALAATMLGDVRALRREVAALRDGSPEAAGDAEGASAPLDAVARTSRRLARGLRGRRPGRTGPTS